MSRSGRTEFTLFLNMSCLHASSPSLCFFSKQIQHGETEQEASAIQYFRSWASTDRPGQWMDASNISYFVLVYIALVNFSRARCDMEDSGARAVPVVFQAIRSSQLAG